jgi:type II secretory pathway component PulJ
MMNAKSSIRSLLKSASGEEGFSLTELLVVVGCMAFILGTAYMALNAVNRMSDGIQAREQAASESSIGLEGVVREMRQARALTTEDHAFVTTSPDRAVFYVDLDHTGAPERVTYYVSNGALYRMQAQSTLALPTGADYGADSAPKLIAHLDPSWTTVFRYYNNGSGTYSSFVAPTVVTTPDGTTAVQITIKSKAKVGATTMTGQASSLVNIRSTSVILNGS